MKTLYVWLVVIAAFVAGAMAAWLEIKFDQPTEVAAYIRSVPGSECGNGRQVLWPARLADNSCHIEDRPKDY